jgi:hypothetical protein
MNNKYIIEGGINFYDELYKSLDDDDDIKNIDYNNVCLITNQPLISKFITLDCGHKFNYIPLFLDIKNHKLKFNLMEGMSSKLKNNEIRCPYCRSKHNNVLPYYEEFAFPKINGVNHYDPLNIHYYRNNKCNHIIQNDSFDESNPVSLKFMPCGIYNAQKIVIYDELNPEQPITYGDDKYYCYKHKKEQIKKYKQEIKDNIKNELKKAKEDMPKLKNIKKQPIDIENVVLGPIIIKNINSNNELLIGCDQILKSGKNKGKLCGCKVLSENMCKRHISLKHKLVLYEK